MALVRISATTATAEEITALIRRDGGCILTEAVPTEVLDDITTEMDPHIEAGRPGTFAFAGYRTVRVPNLIARSASVQKLIMHPLILEVAKQVMAKCDAIQLSNTQLISIGDGESPQGLHRDQDAYPFPFPPGFEVELSTMWPLNTAFTEENGATRVVAGSHLDGARATYPDDRVEYAEMERGSVLLWLGSTYHAGSSNRSGKPRQAVNLAYCVGWLRQEENQYIVVPPEVAATLDDDLLKLMGYEVAAPGFGLGPDFKHPLAVFRDEVEDISFSDADVTGLLAVENPA
ncbi:phytanoyl-CoA dioxygenase family protein [Actinoplanes sp. NPDC051851]|uniref:phytanoyl-CoA dioxygenase family protein n=1 Tax=Actinoplanes sp. NPDC051851 TaxID=3154753 RepID=UPI003425BB80